VGVAYSRTHGRSWRFVNKPFPAPVGNLTFIVTGGKGGGPAPDGYVYAIATEREFNASKLIVGRTRPGVANLTDPYGAGFSAQWISANGQTLRLKWAANFAGCAKGVICSGKYGFNVAKVQLTIARKPPAKARRNLLHVAGGASLALLILAGGTARTRSVMSRPIEREKRST
jgi:hypothetical protein